MNIYQFFKFLWLAIKLGIQLNDWHTSLHSLVFHLSILRNAERQTILSFPRTDPSSIGRMRDGLGPLQ